MAMQQEMMNRQGGAGMEQDHMEGDAFAEADADAMDHLQQQ